MGLNVLGRCYDTPAGVQYGVETMFPMATTVNGTTTYIFAARNFNTNMTTGQVSFTTTNTSGADGTANWRFAQCSSSTMSGTEQMLFYAALALACCLGVIAGRLR